MDAYNGKKDLERQARMADLYRSGLTLEQIGNLYHITRERVRQIIASAGVAASEGGARIRAQTRALDRMLAAEERRRVRSGKKAVA